MQPAGALADRTAEGFSAALGERRGARRFPERTLDQRDRDPRERQRDLAELLKMVARGERAAPLRALAHFPDCIEAGYTHEVAKTLLADACARARERWSPRVAELAAVLGTNPPAFAPGARATTDNLSFRYRHRGRAFRDVAELDEWVDGCAYQAVEDAFLNLIPRRLIPQFSGVVPDAEARTILQERLLALRQSAWR